MIDFLDDANKYTCQNKNCSLPNCQLPCCCVKFEIIFYYPSYLFMCQIIPKISVCVSNYTEAICSCIKFEIFIEIIIYYQSYHEPLIPNVQQLGKNTYSLFNFFN